MSNALEKKERSAALKEVSSTLFPAMGGALILAVALNQFGVDSAIATPLIVACLSAVFLLFQALRLRRTTKARIQETYALIGRQLAQIELLVDGIGKEIDVADRLEDSELVERLDESLLANVAAMLKESRTSTSLAKKLADQVVDAVEAGQSERFEDLIALSRLLHFEALRLGEARQLAARILRESGDV